MSARLQGSVQAILESCLPRTCCLHPPQYSEPLQVSATLMELMADGSPWTGLHGLVIPAGFQ